MQLRFCAPDGAFCAHIRKGHDYVRNTDRVVIRVESLLLKRRMLLRPLR